MIQVNQLGMAFGVHTLFEDVTIQFSPGRRYGIVGANGSGKTTLLKLLTGELHPTSGEINMPSQFKLGVLKQNHFEFENNRILDVVLMGRKKLYEALLEKQRLHQRHELNSQEGQRLAELEIWLNDQGGNQAGADAAAILNGLGLDSGQLEKPMATLSGGYKLRVMLAQCLFSQPDALLFDEPNNHLDLYSIAWLAEYLISYPGIAVVVSHDHHFMNRIATHILDIDYETVTVYKGNYEYFLKQKEQTRLRKETEIARQEKKQAELQAFYEHFRAKATKARQAISRKKQLDHMEEIVIKRSSRQWPKFAFQQKRPSGIIALSVSDLWKSYGEHPVLRGINFEIERGQRLAVIGPNGIGKSTLIKVLAGELKAEQGEVKWGYETATGYFPQNHAEAVAQTSTPYDWLYSYAPSELVGTIRGLLGRMLFSGDDVHKRNAALSGGETARLIFARLMLEKPNVMLLDEPTNHLDLEAIETLSDALITYPGTVIFVSHDRYFVEKVGTMVLELRPDGYTFFEGNYADFIYRKGTDHLEQPVSLSKMLRNKPPKSTDAEPKKEKLNGDVHNRRQWSKELARLESKIAQRETKITAIEKRIEKIDAIFAGTEIYVPERQAEFQKLYAEQQDLKFQISDELTAWEAEQNHATELRGQINEFDSQSNSVV